MTKAAKNRAIDLLRKIKVDNKRLQQIESASSTMALNQLFLEHEIEDSQLRMIFTACHPQLNTKDQIAFALKTIAGFSNKEIAVALLLKEETVKKRLSRARKTIKEKAISFSIPNTTATNNRISRVHEVLYLIFNEGFHSANSEMLIRKELCGEAIRLCTLLLKKETLRTGEGYALFALFCFHASRLETKLLDDDILLDLKHQDRSKWYFPLIELGNNALDKAMTYTNFSSYHLEAAIAKEHCNAISFEATNWKKILQYRQHLYENQPTDYAAMNMAIVLLQLNETQKANDLLEKIDPKNLEKRAYLYYGIQAEYYMHVGNKEAAINFLLFALTHITNKAEKKFIERKIDRLNGIGV